MKILALISVLTLVLGSVLTMVEDPKKPTPEGQAMFGGAILVAAFVTNVALSVWTLVQ